ncbi:peptidase family M28 [Apodospora peruviana]|uniref:Peptide hydrolase n=1 Tax=Apodospora peruviana TaxID=516989 RepID=A0AAE0ME98_9PEZI|nr:peptidase family M28 [Apodospora peruviana]
MSSRWTMKTATAITTSTVAIARVLLVSLVITIILAIMPTPALASPSSYTPLSDTSINALLLSSSGAVGGESSALTAVTAADFDVHTGALLAPILIPRVPATPGSEKVQQHFVDFFRREMPLWTLEWHNSTSTTPATGDKLVPFRNLIFRRDPPDTKPGNVARLTLAAHYDTLYRPEGFIGAIDSAAPCAILMHVARAVDRALTARWAADRREEGSDDGLEDDEQEPEKGVQIIFVDGEEAWVQWTDTDSLYGARALAETWHEQHHYHHPDGGGVGTFSTELESISLFVLLDLLGAPNPRVPSYFAQTHWAYRHLAEAERRLQKLGMLETKGRLFLHDFDKSRFGGGYILDDHVPFMERGVPILHVIPTPFPPVWHTMKDDAAHLDVPTIGDWARIVVVFVAEWMELEGFVEKVNKEEGEVKRGREKEEL